MKAVLGELALVGAEPLDEREQPAERRLPGQLVDDLALCPSHDHRLADRAATLGYHRRSGDLRWQDRGNRGVAEGLAVEDEAVATRAASGRREPTDHDQIGSRLMPVLEEGVDGRGEGVGEQHEGAAWGDVVGHAHDEHALGGGQRFDAHSNGGRAEGPGPQRHCGLLLDLAGASHDRHRGGPQQGAWCQEGADGGGDVLERARVLRGHEEDGQVGRGAEGLEHLADHLAGGLGREGVLRQRGRVRHGWFRLLRGRAACRGRRSARSGRG